MSRTLQLMLAGLILIGCRNDKQAFPTEGVESMRYSGFLSRDDFVHKIDELTAFALVDDPGDLGRPPTEWAPRFNTWCTASESVERFRELVTAHEMSRGNLNVEPTRYLALRFGDSDAALSEIARVGGDGRLRLLVDGGHCIVDDALLELIATAAGHAVTGL